MGFKSYLTFAVIFFYLISSCLLWCVLFALYFILPIKWYYRIDGLFYSITQRGVICFFENLNTRKLHLYGDLSFLNECREKNVLFISNHSSTNLIASRLDSIGKIRYIIGHIYKYIPVFGFYGIMHGYIFVNRNNFNDNLMVKTANFINENKIPYWMVIYPEGRIMNPQRLDLYTKAVSHGSKIGIDPLIYHLTPRLTGTKLIIDKMKESIDYIIDCTIIYGDGNGCPLDKRLRIPGNESWNDEPKTVFIHVEKIPFQHVPNNSDDIDKWIFERFQIKDRFMKKLFERDRYKNYEMTTLPTQMPEKIEDWSSLVEYQPPDYQYTKDCFEKYLKPTEPIENHTEYFNESDGTLKKLSFFKTYLPLSIMIVSSVFCLYHPTVYSVFSTTIPIVIVISLAYLRLFVI